MSEEDGTLRLHIEPARPIEVKDLIAELGSISRQYQDLAQREGYSARADAKLLVASVSRGSIDISLIPEHIQAATVAGTMLGPMVVEQFDAVKKLAERLKWLLDIFVPEKTGAPEPEGAVTVKDCDDAINIVKPIAEAGGQQTISIVKGDVTNISILVTSAAQARTILEQASKKKAELQFPNAERRQRVSLVWYQLAKDLPVTDGKRSPDQGFITDIDKKHHAVLFTDEMAYLKAEMIDEEANPYKKVYFVDVEVSRVSDKVSSYRIVGYHGKDELPDPLAEL